MNKCAILAAVAMLSSGAIAGPAESFSMRIKGDDTAIAFGGATISLDIYGDSSFGTHLVGGQFNLSTSVSEGIISDIRWTPAEWSTVNSPGAFDGNGNYNGVIYGQFIVFTDLFDFLPGHNSELGQLIGTFEVDVIQHCGLIDFNITTDPDPARFALQAADVDFDARTTTFLNSSEGDLSLTGLSIFVVPSPSGVALLGFGGLAATRRRRFGCMFKKNDY